MQEDMDSGSHLMPPSSQLATACMWDFISPPHLKRSPLLTGEVNNELDGSPCSTLYETLATVELPVQVSKFPVARSAGTGVGLSMTNR